MKWLRNLFKPKPRRIEARLVPYSQADDLIQQGWTIAPEEDKNRHIGFVYLERFPVPAQSTVTENQNGR